MKIENLRRLYFFGFLLVSLPLALVLFLIFRPVPLPFLNDQLRETIQQHFPAYKVDIKEALVQWRPLDDTIVLDLYLVKLANLEGRIVASLPQVQLGVKTSTLFDNDVGMRHIKVMNARISLSRTYSGDIKVDIGQTEKGISDKIIEDVLNDLVKPSDDGNYGKSFPAVHIFDSKIFFRDEITGANLRIPKLDLRIKPDAHGIASTINLDIATPNEILQLDSEIWYKKLDGVSVFDVQLDKLRPAILSEMLPGFGYLKPFEVSISGSISGEIDRFLNLNEATFKFSGENGSLEVSDLIGYNLDLLNIDFAGNYSGQSNNIEIDSFHLVTGNGTIDSTGIFVWKNERLYILSKIMVTENSVFSLAPRLFSQLPPDMLETLKSSYLEKSKSVVTTEGVYDSSNGKFEGSGKISQEVERDKSIADSNPEIDLVYKIDGPLMNISNITIEPQ